LGDVVGQVSCCLADDFQVADNGILRLAVSGEYRLVHTL